MAQQAELILTRSKNPHRFSSGEANMNYDALCYHMNALYYHMKVHATAQSLCRHMLIILMLVICHALALKITPV